MCVNHRKTAGREAGLRVCTTIADVATRQKACSPRKQGSCKRLSLQPDTPPAHRVVALLTHAPCARFEGRSPKEGIGAPRWPS